MQSLKQKTISGLFWSGIENVANLGTSFIFGIILARLIGPAEFGIVAIATVFLSLAKTFVSAGFTDALIQKQNCTDADYSTVFFFNIAAGLLFYLILYLSAPYISIFYKNQRLTPVIRVINLVLLIESLTLVQRTILVKNVLFKIQTQITLISLLVGGVVGIVLAYKGFGVWSLVAKHILISAITTLLFWMKNKWRPILVFSKESFVTLFSFGSKLLYSALLTTLWKNIYTIVIGKYFSPEILGHFSRAQQFKNLPSQNINSMISRVTYPVLSQQQSDLPRLKANSKILLKSTGFIIFPIMLLMAACAESMILTLLGEQWRQTIIYLQLLCFSGMLYPLHSLNLNILKICRRSDLVLRISLWVRFLGIICLVIGILYGIEIMLIYVAFNGQIVLLLNSQWTGKLIGYSYKEQITDILPSFLVGLLSGLIVYLLGNNLHLSSLWVFLIQVITGSILVISISELIKNEGYLHVKNILLEKLKAINLFPGTART